MKTIIILLIMIDKKSGNKIKSKIHNFCLGKKTGDKIYLASSVPQAKSIYKRKKSRPHIVMLDKAMVKRPGKLIQRIINKARNPFIFYIIKKEDGLIDILKTSEKICQTIGLIRHQRKQAAW